MVKLKWLQVERFRQAAPCRLEFSDGFNVLLGKNGTGKTNLLKLIAMILKGDFSALEEEEFSFAYRLESGTNALRVALQGWFEELPESMPEAPPAPRGSIRRFSYTLALSSGRNDVVVRTAKEAEGRLLVREAACASPAPSPLSPNFLRDIGTTTTPAGSAELFPLVVQFIPMAESPGRFNEALGAYESILNARETQVGERTELSPGPFSLAIQAPIEKEGGLSLQARFVPLQVVFHLLRDSDQRSFETIRVDQEGWPDLEQWARVLGFECVTLHSTRSQRRMAAAPVPHVEHVFSALTFQFTLPDGTIINQDQLSFGQKRLLSFLWYLACNQGGIIIADELVNGLHHAWIEHVMRSIPPRQAFIASQNPLLFDFLTFQDAEEVRRTFVLCDLEEGERRRRWRWGAMDEKTAAGFFRAYEVGIQHVSELLRTKGIW